MTFSVQTTPAGSLQDLLTQVHQHLQALLGQAQSWSPITAAATAGGPVQQSPTQGAVVQAPFQKFPMQSPLQSPMQSAPMKAPMKGSTVTAGGPAPTYVVVEKPKVIRRQPIVIEQPVIVEQERRTASQKRRRRGGGGTEQKREAPKSYIRAHNNGNGEMGSRDRHEAPHNLRTKNGDPGNNSSSTKRSSKSKVGNGRTGNAR